MSMLIDNKELTNEWDYVKNQEKGLDINKLTHGSRYKAWWICPNGHSYEKTINKRAIRGDGCPYCSGRKVLKGFNDLETLCPDVAKEWSFELNNTTPDMYSRGSGFKAWWKCPKGHAYQATIHDRTSKRGTNCPICNIRKQTSFPEQAIFYYVKQIFPDAISKYKDIFEQSMELDIFIPSIKLGIEYDGLIYHNNEATHKRELKKYNICRKNGIKLYRIKEKITEKDIGTFDKAYSIENIKNRKQLELQIQLLLNEIDPISNPLTRKKPIFSSRIWVDLDKDKNKILSYLYSIDNSLAVLRPDVAAKWNYEKNNNLLPEMFSVSSNETVFWKCEKCGNEWKASINSMTRAGRNGCPTCSKKERGKKATLNKVKKVGSLAETNPELEKDWNYEKNIDLSPYEITAGRFKTVWWKCSKCGYEWEASPNNRKKGIGCPCCSGRVPKKGYNDFKTWCINNGKEYLLKEWDYSKNDNKPEDFLPKSDRVVWWKCSKCGYEWEKAIKHRTIGRNCPKCSDRRRKDNK